MNQSTERDDRLYQFGPFCLHAGERVLVREGRLVPLAPKAVSTLLVLVQNMGHVVEKDLLMAEVWPHEVVEEGNLAQHIFTLRKALGETNETPTYIETVPRRGYRFVAPVRGPYEEKSKLDDDGIQLFDRRKGKNEPPADMQSIAVLPFETLGAESHDEYLGLGIADALITKLSNLKRLTVRPTSAVRNAMKGDPVSAGGELKVATVLEGTIQKWDEHIRVTVQLVGVRDGATLWAERFDEKFTSIFAIEDSISEQVARALAVKLTSDEQKQLAKRSTENTKAHQAYLRGRYFLEKRTQEGFVKGIEYFESAISIDTNYALAYAGLADCYCQLGAYEVIPPKESVPKAKEAALKALSIEPNLAEAHAALGRARLFEWDWQGAEQSFKLAIELNANYATGRTLYALYLRLLRRFAESLAQARKAEELDPTSAARVSTIGGILYWARHYGQALEHLWQAVELDSNNHVAHCYLGLTYIQKAMYEEAIAECEKTISLFGKGEEVLAHLGYVYAVSGRKEAARKVLAELAAISNRDYVPSYFKALVYIGLEEKEQAFECLETAYREHDLNLSVLGIDPLLDSLRQDPRFTSLLQRTGLMLHLQETASDLKDEGDPVVGVPELENDDYAKEINSLAILPFSNASNDPNMEYLSDGITESIMSSLSNLPQLKLMARSTVFRLKGMTVDPQKVGRTLGVRAVLMGWVQQLGNRLVISIELVDVNDGSRIMGHQYHSEGLDIFLLQEELAWQISEKLRLRLSGAQRERLTKRFTESTQAYESYLKGRYSWNKRTNKDLEKGIKHFRQAIAEDPNYCLAHAGMADCLLLFGLLGAKHPRQVMPEAKAAAIRAIQLEHTLGEAHASLAHVKFLYDWNWEEAGKDYHHAIQLNPTYPTARHWHGEYLISMGCLDEGIAELKRARDLDPLSLIINTNFGLAYYWARQYDLAIEHLERAIELEPNFFRAHVILGMVYERKSMHKEAIAELDKARSIDENPWTLAGPAHIHASFGDRAKATELLDRLLELSEHQYVSAFTIAVIYAGFDDQADQTFAWLEKACKERDPLLVWLNLWPFFDAVRSDPRFIDLLRRIGLVETSHDGRH